MVDCEVASYFLLTKYRNALPRVWSSFSIWNEAACDDAPGNYGFLKR